MAAVGVGLAVTVPARASSPVDGLVRQTCSYVWVDGACEATAYADPGYATDVDPSPGQPYALRIGAVHEHSSYSDGDPNAVPRDYFEAARTGVNGTGTGVALDFLLSSEHSDNGDIPITTSADCLDPARVLECAHLDDPDHLEKWVVTLQQAEEVTAASGGSFTAMRGFEWTNDVYNHMNVYLSTNAVNVKIDGSYLSMDVMWDWLREPVARGGGADALVTFNHPGRPPSLTPFDSGLPHSELLAALGGENWNDVAYVPDVDDRVAGMEVNGGDDIEFYVLGLTNGWHIGPVAAEDEHGRSWASAEQGKTLMLTRGTTPGDYYWAFRNHRTVAVLDPLIGGAPGTRATAPTIHYWADGGSIQDPAATVLGGVAGGAGPHVLHAELAGLPAGARAALVSNRTGGQAAPVQLGAAGADGTFVASHTVGAPATGEDWWFLVVCPPEGEAPCGADQSYWAVTAPIWVAP